MIAIGPDTKANASNTIAIGSGAQATKEGSIAIGSSNALAKNAIVIGQGSKTEADDAIIIGSSITSSIVKMNGTDMHFPVKRIHLGNSDQSVLIPGTLYVKDIKVVGDSMLRGNLYVGGSSYLGTEFANGRTYIRDPRYTEGTKLTSLDIGSGNLYHTNGTQPPGTGGYAAIADCMGGEHPSSWYCSNYSDRRLKDIIGENLDAMDKINKLKVYNYTYKKDDLKTPHVGVVAQELEKIFPNAISKDENGFLQIRHEDMFYAMINALKELYAKLVEKDHEIKVLKKEVKELRKEVNELKKLIKNRY